MSIETPFDPEERRIEAMMDGSGFSRERAEIALGKKVVTGSTELPPTPGPARKRRRSGHVRDFESDRDHQLAEERANYQPADPEQPHINARGRAAVEAALDEAFGRDRVIKAIEAEVHRLIPIDPDNVAKSEADRERMITARLRTHFEQKR